jgi:hypothetical protein
MARSSFFRCEITLPCVATLLAIVASIAHAIEEIELTIDAISGADWSANGLSARLDLLEEAQVGTLEIQALHVADLAQPIRDVRIECATVEISTVRIGCNNANVVAQVPGLGAQRFHADLVYGRADGSIQFAIRGIRIDSGRLALSGSLRDEGWNVIARSEQLPLKELMTLARTFEVVLPVSGAAGAISADVQARGAGAGIAALAIKAQLHELTANNDSGSIASDRLTMTVDAQLRKEAEQWRYKIDVSAHAGQAYVEPFFVDFGVHALAADAAGLFTESGALIIDTFHIEHADVLAASGRTVVDMQHSQPVRELELKLGKLQFPGAYESYLQPLLLDTNFKALQTSGALSGEIAVTDGAPTDIKLSIANIGVDGGAENFSIRELGGNVRWRKQEESPQDRRSLAVPASELHWTSAALYGLELGTSSLKFTTQERNVRLIEPARIPLLDGALQLDSLRVRNAGLPSVAFMIDATIEPISAQRLCQAFGWPEFGGRVGGTISKLRMREGIVTLGTTLEARVFDGVVRVSDLRLEEPFGKWPRFYSSIDLQNLDLELVTGAFSFGRITGRMSGAIKDLELFNWAPIAFDARLFTPPSDSSRHRISQRAVENIGSIGGGGAGVTAALSSGFLRFFDDFNYKRLGISCRLHNEVCEMNGVAPAPNGGYYLVQGRGLPRIDVIGNSRRVDWPRLVQQLIAATESGGPVVQ